MKDENPLDENQSSLEDYLRFEEEGPSSSESTTQVDEEISKPIPEVEDTPNPTSSNALVEEGSENEDEEILDDNEEEVISDISIGAQDTPQNLPPSFLLSIDYSGPLNKAIARLYEPKSKRIYFWEDNTGHKPYLYTDWPAQMVESKTRRNPGFIKTETVDLHDLLHDKPVTMTKLIGDNPLAIGGGNDSMRNVLKDNSGVSHAWEANIRYHLCYTYDTELVPGLMYKIENGDLIPCPPDVDRKTLEEFKDTIAKEKGLESIISTYSPMFFTTVPDIKRLAVDIEVYTPVVNRIPDTRAAQQPVTAIGLSDNEGYNKCFVLRRKGMDSGEKGKDFPKELEIVYYDDESEMLVEAFKIIDSYPIVLTFVGDSFDLKYLYNRAKALRIDLDRYCPIVIRGNQDPRREQANLKRGIHVDMYKFFGNPSIKIYALSGAYQRENLDTIAAGILGVGKLALSDNISNLSYYELAHYCWLDANLVLRFTEYEHNLLLRLMVLLMRISRMSLGEVTRFYISSWIQSLFRQEHRSKKYLLPRRVDIDTMKQPDAQTEAMIGGKAFKGAIVIEPVAGVHFDATVLDFASLYPTIMKAHNISYETIDCPHEECRTAGDNRVPETDHWICKKNRGMISQTIGFFRDTRVNWFKPKSKDKKLDEATRNWYSVVEKALKVFVNASYGVTGAQHFELFCMPAAESVTAFGRDAIIRTKAKSEAMGIRVLYGDTDSVFLDNPTPEQQKELVKWSREVLGIDLEVEKTYKYVALSDRKKNYIGVYKDGRVEVKGLSGKKRNTPDFAQEAFRKMLEVLSRVDDAEGFEAAKDEIREIVNCVIDRLEGKTEEYSPSELAYRIQLTKRLSDYPTDTPHVRAAKMLVEKTNDPNKVQPGTIIEFIRVKGQGGVIPVEIAKDVSYYIDKDTYIDILKSVFEQVLDSVGLDFNEFLGFTTLDKFF
ncbi:MAG: DNA-directed DNA polymerase I [Candidatus Thorarchaeota archaeon]|nr:DNA-directed DNA polymerase I [Candidatus Thorarchaeota archaeon]